eukprot:809741-Amphidinium_carterae.1
MVGSAFSVRQGLSTAQFAQALTHSRFDEVCVRTAGLGDPAATESGKGADELEIAAEDARRGSTQQITERTDKENR